jgi:hypothetical protein
MQDWRLLNSVTMVSLAINTFNSTSLLSFSLGCDVTHPPRRRLVPADTNRSMHYNVRGKAKWQYEKNRRSERTSDHRIRIKETKEKRHPERSLTVLTECLRFQTVFFRLSEQSLPSRKEQTQKQTALGVDRPLHHRHRLMNYAARR